MASPEHLSQAHEQTSSLQYRKQDALGLDIGDFAAPMIEADLQKSRDAVFRYFIYFAFTLNCVGVAYHILHGGPRLAVFNIVFNLLLLVSGLIFLVSTGACRQKIVLITLWGFAVFRVFKVFLGGDLIGVDLLLMVGMVALAYGILHNRLAYVYSVSYASSLVLGSLASHYGLLPKYFEDQVLSPFIAAPVAFVVFTIMASNTLYRNRSEAYIQALTQNRDRIRKVTHDYRNLISVAMHDLSNDLFLARSGFDILQQENATAQMREKSMQRLKRGLSSLSELVQALRFLRDRTDSGDLDQNSAAGEVDVVAVISKAKFLFEDQINSKHLKVETRIDEFSSRLRVDPVFFEFQIFNNIFSNALKFALPNSVVTIEAAIVHSMQYRISITNLGPKSLREGFDKRIRSLGQKETSGAQSGTQGEVGQGLGLSILWEFAQKLELKFYGEATERDDGLVEFTVSVCLPIRSVILASSQRVKC